MDEAFKQIRRDLIKQQLLEDELTGNYWHEIVDILSDPFGISNKIERSDISKEDFEELVKYADMQYQNAFKKLRSIDKSQNKVKTSNLRSLHLFYIFYCSINISSTINFSKFTISTLTNFSVNIGNA